MQMQLNRMVLGLICLLGTCLSVGFAANADEPAASGDAGSVQERGITDKLKGRTFEHKFQPQPGGTPPPQLCHTETIMMTQCKCFNQTECQPLTALFPGSCPAGSQHCEFVPMSRGAMPPLPPNLCGYQVPLTLTECSCHNVAECQLLSPFCPSACPVGSQTCTCRPLQRR
ncbi:MAG: hypothetical protein ACXWV7_05515 [Nitrospira sp.]|jgi:hypothetical protein